MNLIPILVWLGSLLVYLQRQVSVCDPAGERTALLYAGAPLIDPLCINHEVSQATVALNCDTIFALQDLKQLDFSFPSLIALISEKLLGWKYIYIFLLVAIRYEKVLLILHRCFLLHQLLVFFRFFFRLVKSSHSSRQSHRQIHF